MKYLKKLLYEVFSENTVKWVYFTFFKRKLKLAFESSVRIDENNKYDHITEAVNYCRIANLPFCYYEFGCHSGRTFSAALRAFSFYRMKPFNAVAFDSFEGLPDTNSNDDGVFRAGSFFTTERNFKKIVKIQSGVSDRKYKIVKGFYEKSLTPELAKSLPKPGIVHIDVDLYSSTVSVLDFIKHSITPGCVIMFDDWFCFNANETKGEKKAVYEFLENNPNWKLDHWKNYGAFGRSFFVTENNSIQLNF